MVIRSAVAAWKPLVGLGEARRLVEDLAEDGTTLRPIADRWEDLGDYVMVTGAMETSRGDVVERTPSWWVFHVREGRIASITNKLSGDEAFDHVLWDRR